MAYFSISKLGNNPFLNFFRLCLVTNLVSACVLCMVAGAVQPLYPEITVVSYLLRDRAIVLDSLVMRKRMIFSFKSSKPLSSLKRGSIAEGTISHEEVGVMARDTAYIFDEPAANLGFELPYEIPDGTYRLDIRIISRAGELLESYSGDFDREELKPYLMRGINFWDFTKPYAHLECSGYGELTYHFNSEQAVDRLAAIEISARLMSDNSHPTRTRVSLNGILLGEFELPPAVRGTPPKVVTWRIDQAETLAQAAVQKGENSLLFSIPEELNEKGIRIYAHKNSRDPALDKGMPLAVKVVSEADGKPVENLYRIPVWGEEGEHITCKFSIPPPDSYKQEIIQEEQEPFPLGSRDIRSGYVVFRRHWLEYVYPWTVPVECERADSLSLRLAGNDFEPLTFSIYPLRDLGEVRVSVGDLTGPDGKSIPSGNIQVHVARPVKIRTGGTRYRLVPRMLERTDRASIPIGYTTRFWLTLHADRNTSPGVYCGMVRLESEHEPAMDIPLTVKVLPVRLEPVPGITYSMFMTYEFFELESKEWNAEQRKKIYEDGVNVFRDFKNHGMTSVDVSTPYFFQWNFDGTPRMEHFKAMVKAAKEVGFTRPIFWYFAHYVQAAKKQHPGSVLLYDRNVHPGRARRLVETAQRLARELKGPPVYYVPIDEPRVALREKITLDLLKEVKKVPGARTMSSTDIGGKLLDIENNSTRHRKRLGPGEKKRHSEREVWEYHNAAISTLNPGFSRYIYGYYTWRQDLDGMNSWGFNTAENSRGHPYEDLDHPRSDWNLAYPHPGGPLPTPNWEALREGIDDVRFVYQLEKLIKAKNTSHPHETAQADKYLDEIRTLCDIDEREIVNGFGRWTPEAFDRLRCGVIDWIKRLDSL
ncbi:MAG: hypothetical protein U9N45_04155 [Gemmatimonadota bacterium]|nr:hypothetical protein [Gemmatimonadota bacterium]